MVKRWNIEMEKIEKKRSPNKKKYREDVRIAKVVNKVFSSADERTVCLFFFLNCEVFSVTYF